MAKQWNLSRVGLFDINFDSGDAYWSRELRAMLGIPDDVPADFELLLRCIHPQDRRAFAAAAARTFQPNSPRYTTIEPRIIDRDGEVRQLRVDTATVFRNSSARDAVRLVGLVVELGCSNSAGDDETAHGDAAEWVSPTARQAAMQAA